MTVNSRVIKTFLQWSPDAVDVPLMNGLRIQILPTISDLPRARKYQFAAFIAKDAILVVWDDDPLNIVSRAKFIENELMALVWKTPEEEAAREDKQLGIEVEEIIDEESGEVSGYRERRPTNLLNTILVAFTLTLVITTLGAGYRQIAIEVAVDGNMLRLAFVALTPIQIFFTLVSYLFFPSPIPGRLFLNREKLVFRTSYRGLSRPVFWTSIPVDGELKILLGQTSTTDPDWRPPAHHHPMPRLQGGSSGCYCSNNQVYQTSNLYIRAPGRHRKHFHQR